MSEGSASIYEVVGGEAAIRDLVDRFYDRMDGDDEWSGLRGMHAHDLAESRERLSLFLVAWWGGPTTYHRTYGHPRLRASHARFPIDAPMRDAWLSCMRATLRDVVPDPDLVERLMGYFEKVAEHIRNC